MKRYLFFLFSLFVSNSLFAQGAPPQIQWAKCIGGGAWEILNCIRQTNDGGYIFAGNSNYSGFHGLADYWIVKTNDTGKIQWQKDYGGSGDDEPSDIRQTNDGGYIIVGYTGSTDGDVTGNHGGNDYWVVKIDSNGAMQWEKCYGGSSNDYGISIIQTKDNGYMVTGTSFSADGEVTGHHGSDSTTDTWILKIDSVGNIKWQKSLGGSSYEDQSRIIQTYDGGYVISGESNSNDGDVSGHHGDNSTADYWVVKIDSNGGITWQNSFGGTADDIAYDVEETNDSGYIIAGVTDSKDGDVTGNHGSGDAWIIKLHPNGSKQWEKCYGGSLDDEGISILKTGDGGFIVSCISKSSDGDVQINRGNYDVWLFKIDSSGTLQWSNTYGGSGEDAPANTLQTNDGGYIVGAYTMSTDGEVVGNHGGFDYWIVKLGGNNTFVKEITYPDIPEIFSYPNPFRSTTTVELGALAQSAERISVVDMLGKEIAVLKHTGEELSSPEVTWTPDAGVPSGTYFIRVISRAGEYVKPMLYMR